MGKRRRPVGGQPVDEIHVTVDSVPGKDRWWQVLERAFEEVTKTEEGRELYGDPARGATLPQAWRTSFLLTGIDSVCLAVDTLTDDATEGITRLVKFPRDQVIDLLTQAFASPENALTIYESDGRTGHAVTLLGWKPRSGRFLFHDPWPGDSLLAAANNVAGIAARPEADGEWSVTRDELSKVIVAAMLDPAIWADLTGNPSRHPYATLRKSEFFSFFGVRETKTENRGSDTEISLKPGGFQEHVDLTILTIGKGRVYDATLRMRESWVIGPPMGVNPFALDLTKSFLMTLAPAQDHEDVSRLAETLWRLRDLEAMRKTLQDPKFSDTPEGRFIAAYTGVHAPFRLALGYCAVEVSSVPEKGEPWVNIEVSL